MGWFFKPNNMKLYTEEQVKFIYNSYGFNLDQNGCHEIDEDKYFEQKLKELTPIELPSDEEIEKFTDTMFYGEKKYFVKTGAFWMKQQILNQNK